MFLTFRDNKKHFSGKGYTMRQIPNTVRAYVHANNGILITFLGIGLTELLTRFVIGIDVPADFLTLLVAYATYRGGVRQGTLSAFVGILYLLYFFSMPDQLFQYRTDDMRHAIVHVLWLPTVVLLVGLLHNQLERQRRVQSEMQKKLQNSEELYRTLARNIPNAAVLIFNNELRYTLTEGPALAASGFSKETMHNKTIWEVLPPKSAKELETAYRDALNGKHLFIERFYNGRYYDAQILPVRNEQGKIIAGMIFTQDVTERKQYENLLAAEKERLAVTLQSIGDGVIATNSEGNIVFLNPIAQELTGYSANEAVNQPLPAIVKLINEPTRQPVPNPVEKVLATRQPVKLSNHTLLISRQGEEYHIADSAAPIRDKENQLSGVVMVFRDVTQEKKLTEELTKASRLESVGLLAGGIAHDFNNLLTPILGGVALARLNTSPHEVEEALDLVEGASLQAKELARQLLTFAKGGTPIKQVTRLNSNIRQATTFALHGAQVTAEFKLAENLWAVEADIGQIEQVFQNLVLNAVQAMPNGGTIHIEGNNIELPSAVVIPLPPGRYIKITVKDEGAGITADTLKYIFEPYFTTKTNGNGLGLATCYSIVKRHDGYISAESVVGRGTTFSIFLPAAQFPAKDRTTQSQINLQGSARILIMDDERTIRTVLTRMLTRLGYAVEAVEDGQAALNAYRLAVENRQPFEVVIMDLTVAGGMGGQEAISKLLEYDRQARVIVSSGYSNEAISANYRDYGFKAALNKPYRINELVEVVKKVLEE
jgi:two-component system, cell cycle sensor histidine kinase and response regulator CckA